MLNRIVLALFVAGTLVFAGCQMRPATAINNGNENADVTAINYQAIDTLMQSRQQAIERNQRILVATLVDINDVNRASMFGRITAELLATRLTQDGFTVVNAKLRNKSIVVKDEGEFALSRDMRELSNEYNAKAVLAGTYARSGDRVFVSVRLVKAEDNTVIGAVDYVLPYNQQVMAMFGEAPYRPTFAGGAKQ